MNETTVRSSESGMGLAMRLLGDAADRRLIAVTDLVDRPHLLRVPDQVDADQGYSEASEVETEGARDLLRSGLAQLGAELPETVRWNGEEVHGRHVLPTIRGRASLDRWLLGSDGRGWRGA